MIHRKIVSGPATALLHGTPARYVLNLEVDTATAISALAVGVRAARVKQLTPVIPGFDTCELELDDGSFVRVFAREESLETRFEVTSIGAEHSTEPLDTERIPLTLTPPVTVSHLRTEEWQDSSVDCGETAGSDPVMQCQGIPGSAPGHASVVCEYTGGFRLRGSNGAVLTVATLPNPYLIYVSNLANADTICESAYSEMSPRV